MRGGPGETQIELDRRMIGERIKRIKERLEKVKRQRSTQRRARERSDAFRISLVGYTNAGKSTLFNALVKAGRTPPTSCSRRSTRRRASCYLDGAGRSVLAVRHGRLHPRPAARR